jgi:hypothetical protein
MRQGQGGPRVCRERLDSAPARGALRSRGRFEPRIARGVNVVHLTPNWNIDATLEIRTFGIQPTNAADRGGEQAACRRVFVARSRVLPDPPSARILDIQIVHDSPVTSAAAERAKLVHGPASKRIPPRYHDPLGMTRVDESCLASSLQGAARAASHAASRAWFRAQQETAGASTMEYSRGQLDVYA